MDDHDRARVDRALLLRLLVAMLVEARAAEARAEAAVTEAAALHARADEHLAQARFLAAGIAARLGRLGAAPRGAGEDARGGRDCRDEHPA